MNDLDRLREEYASRQERFSGSDRYTLFNPGNLFIVQQRQRNILKLLRKYGFYPLANSSILDLGCGNGVVLLEYTLFGALPERIQGCDLLLDRVKHARQNLPAQSNLAIADGQQLPYPSHCFDLVLQYTVFSSILSDPIKQNLATEMIRVLRPGGMILWYDFWLNPTNPQTRGIRPAEIRQLFPGCQIDFERITLAPPIARKLAPVSWILCSLLEKLWLFNTHYLAAIRKG